MIKKVEIALLHEDHTWDTSTIEVDVGDTDSLDDAIGIWFSKVGLQSEKYKDVVQVALWDEDPDG